MKYLMIIICILLVTACTKQNNLNRSFANSSSNLTASNTQLEYSKDTLIIFFDATIGENYLLDAVKENHAQIIYRYNVMNGMAIKINKTDNLDQCLNYFKSVKGVLSVEKDYITKIH